MYISHCPLPVEDMDGDEVAVAQAAIENCAWFNAMVSSPTFHVYTRMNKNTSDHYVLGRRSPFLWKLGVKSHEEKERQVLVAAVWSGRCATNMGGMIQGGGIAAIFDVVTATLGSVCVEPMSFGMTKSLHVRYRSPAPLSRVVKVETSGSSFNLDAGTCTVTAVLSDGDSDQIFATCEAELVDIRRRTKWKKRERPFLSKL